MKNLVIRKMERNHNSEAGQGQISLINFRKILKILQYIMDSYYQDMSKFWLICKAQQKPA